MQDVLKTILEIAIWVFRSTTEAIASLVCPQEHLKMSQNRFKCPIEKAISGTSLERD